MTLGPIDICRLGPADLGGMRALNALFAEVFDEAATYLGAPPEDCYLARLLGREEVVALVVRDNGTVIAGLVAYELTKLERRRSEIYIYDLAVAVDHRRRGLATALIAETRRIARARGAWTVFIQADAGDGPAVALYRRLGTGEEVLHFDIEP